MLNRLIEAFSLFVRARDAAVIAKSLNPEAIKHFLAT